MDAGFPMSEDRAPRPCNQGLVTLGEADLHVSHLGHRAGVARPAFDHLTQGTDQALIVVAADELDSLELPTRRTSQELSQSVLGGSIPSGLPLLSKCEAIPDLAPRSRVRREGSTSLRWRCDRSPDLSLEPIQP